MMLAVESHSEHRKMKLGCKLHLCRIQGLDLPVGIFSVVVTAGAGAEAAPGASAEPELYEEGVYPG